MSFLSISLLFLAIGAADLKGSPMTEVVQGNNRFAIDLYGRLRDKPGNLFLSPYSISTALAMTYAGARTETAQEMARVLHFKPTPDEVHRAFASLIASFNATAPDRGYRLDVANRLWGKVGFHFLPEFLELTRSRYGAELAEVDFDRADQARQQINTWVEQRTQGKIKDLIPPGVLDPTTRLVLTNAIYFKGKWSSPFDKAATKEAAFHVGAGPDVRVPMMSRKADFPFFEGEGMKALEVPYGQGELTMVVLLPDDVAGLAALERRVTPEVLTKWFSGLQKREVEVSLPRFTMTSRFELADTLKAMGMTRAFTPGQSDFSGMSSEEGLSISAVIHQAFVDVNEEGTEAAAATAVAMRSMAVMVTRKPAVFRADHPFLFLIRDLRSGSILFLGRVMNPQG